RRDVEAASCAPASKRLAAMDLRGIAPSELCIESGSPSRTRTCDHSINSRMLYQLSYRGSAERDIAEFVAMERAILPLAAPKPLRHFRIPCSILSNSRNS